MVFGKNFEKLTVFSGFNGFLTVFSASTTKKSPVQAKNLGTPFFASRRRAKNFPRTFSFSSEDPPQKNLVTTYDLKIGNFDSLRLGAWHNCQFQPIFICLNFQVLFYLDRQDNIVDILIRFTLLDTLNLSDLVFGVFASFAPCTFFYAN